MHVAYLRIYILFKKKIKILAKINTNLSSDESVTETQQTSCKIATEKLVTSAHASVTRVLTGTCNTSKK